MATFPELSITPEIDAWSDEIAYDPTIRSDYEGGYTLTRARFTRIRRKWNVRYLGLDTNDYQTLKNFEESVKVGSEMFEWQNPADGNIYTVRFLKPIKYKLVANKYKWDAQFVLEEV